MVNDEWMKKAFDERNQMTGEIEIYYEPEGNFPFTPTFYNPKTGVAIAGPRSDNPSDLPSVLNPDEEFRKMVEGGSPYYKKIIVSKIAFEELQEAAKKRDRNLARKIIEEKFSLPD